MTHPCNKKTPQTQFEVSEIFFSCLKYEAEIILFVFSTKALSSEFPPKKYTRQPFFVLVHHCYHIRKLTVWTWNCLCGHKQTLNHPLISNYLRKDFNKRTKINSSARFNTKKPRFLENNLRDFCCVKEQLTCVPEKVAIIYIELCCHYVITPPVRSVAWGVHGVQKVPEYLIFLANYYLLATPKVLKG